MCWDSDFRGRFLGADFPCAVPLELEPPLNSVGPFGGFGGLSKEVNMLAAEHIPGSFGTFSSSNFLPVTEEDFSWYEANFTVKEG